MHIYPVTSDNVISLQMSLPRKHAEFFGSDSGDLIPRLVH